MSDEGEGVLKREDKATQGRRVRETARKGEKQSSERGEGKMGTGRRHTKRGEAEGVSVACRQLIECH